MLDWKNEKRPVVALAPMADMTDSAFCRVAKRRGCRVVFREMVSAEALVRGSDKTLAMAAFHDEERPIVLQLFGSDPSVMAEATRILDERYDPDAFDINMGCPARKIAGNFNGASLMREPDRATSIIRAMKTTTTKPVSAKTRLGWSRPDEILDFVKILENAGAELISIHGRTKSQRYSGEADWNMIGRAKSLVSVPVFANGDIFSAEAAVEAIRVTDCDGMLIARGALGNPWLFRQIEDTFAGHEPEPVTDEMRVSTVLEHARLHSELHDGDRPIITFRKHLTGYFRGIPGARRLRERLVQVETMVELEELLEQF
ncbi:MAG: tRNA dihydrouridine synthase DusB [Patescibacteria group bacterium]|nr:tRNA dihydrouridine synthase DusB [Patescibacteria group bacterium]